MKRSYNLFRNTSYALAGVDDMFRHETSFRLELTAFVVLQTGLFWADMSFFYLAILRLSLFLPLIAEAANSAIERTVDLVTQDYREMAKRAKDVGSACVFLSILLTILVWTAILYYAYFF